MSETNEADLPEPVGPKISACAFIERSSRLCGPNVTGAPPRLKKVIPGSPVPVVRPQNGAKLVKCCANMSLLYHSFLSNCGLKTMGNQRMYELQGAISSAGSTGCSPAPNNLFSSNTELSSSSFSESARI